MTSNSTTTNMLGSSRGHQSNTVPFEQIALSYSLPQAKGHLFDCIKMVELSEAAIASMRYASEVHQSLRRYLIRDTNLCHFSRS